MIEASPASLPLRKPAASNAIESRKCEGCDVTFVPLRKNQRYHDEPCRKRAENKRRRGPSFTEQVIAVKGRKCGVCGSEAEGKRTAFHSWEPEDEKSIDRAVVLCSYCLEQVQAVRKGQVKLARKHALNAEQDPSERDHYSALGISILPEDDCDVVDSAPNIIDKSNLDEASAETHPKDLFCKYCEKYLCQVSPDGNVIALGKREVAVENGAVACRWCRAWGRQIWTKLKEALPDTVSHGPIAPERLRKVEKMPLNGRTVAEMLHDLKIATITGVID